MKTDSTYSDAHKILEALNEHDRRKQLPRKLQRMLRQRPQSHLSLFNSIREEFGDIAEVREAQTPTELIKVLKDVSGGLLSGKYRPGSPQQNMENYAICADYCKRLKAKVAQFEAAA